MAKRVYNAHGSSKYHWVDVERYSLCGKVRVANRNIGRLPEDVTEGRWCRLPGCHERYTQLR